MSLAEGTRLGPYEVIAQIGVGGMGEVYRATDTNLKRDVAIKILPESVATNGDQLARFQREAELLASLNHPHIAAIYGLERSQGTMAIVMELVEGDTLAERLARSEDRALQETGRGRPSGRPIPIDEALPIAKQIAEALEAAHVAGIIHRDLKPANIKVSADGAVKVLDFGLAKAFERVDTRSTDASRSPTITTPAMTHIGTLLGTAGYMSPEQARGKPLDKRTDVWSFGCVLFEMLTGKRPFEGEDVGDTLAAVLRSEPDWTALPTAVPAAVRTVIGRCLEKDRKQRIGDMSAALFVLSEPTILAGTATASHAAIATLPRPTFLRRVALPVGAALAAAVVAGGVVWLATRPAVVAPRVSRLQITPASVATPTTSNGATRDIAMTPDGTEVIYVGADGNLFVRPLNQLESTPLTVAGTPTGPFVSPDGQWIGFGDGITLKKVAISGGPAVTLAQVDAVPARCDMGSRTTRLCLRPATGKPACSGSHRAAS